MNASMNFITPGSPSTPPSFPPNKPNPMEQRKLRERDKLKKQQLQIQQKLKKLGPPEQPKKPLTTLLKAYAARLIEAQDPNDDPMALFAQVRPLISKLGMVTMVVPNKTELMLGKTQAKNSNYCIQLRRTAEITPTIIDRIKRMEKNLDLFIWDQAGIKMYVWWPYTPPAQEGAPPVAPVGPAP